LKFKLDENLPADLLALLRREGQDASDVTEEGMRGGQDLSVLQAATAEGRVLLTFDTDFANIRDYPLGSHAGIVVFRLHDQRWQSLEGPARRVLTPSNLERLERGLAIVDETRIRCRRPK
jgi:predicted nuclease of predicted toxin-antitoxin system